MTHRAQWTSEDMKNALCAVKEGKLSKRAISRRFGIPRRTLQNHITSDAVHKKLGRKFLLEPKDEDKFVSRILSLADVGMPVTAKMIRIQAYVFCVENGVPHKFKSQIAGEKWLRGFLKRHPEIACRRVSTFNPECTQKLSEAIINDHLDKYEAHLKEFELENHISNEQAENVTVDPIEFIDCDKFNELSSSLESDNISLSLLERKPIPFCELLPTPKNQKKRFKK